MVRCEFKCIETSEWIGINGKVGRAKLVAIARSENNKQVFADYPVGTTELSLVPSGTIELNIINPGQFEAGEIYYIDFIPIKGGDAT